MAIVVINSLSCYLSYGFYYRWKQLLLSAGWTVARSSNGVDSSGPADYILSANDLNHQYSWLVMRDPADGREHMVRWYTTSYTYTNWYTSQSAHFTGGNHIDTYPTATDIRQIQNNQVISNSSYRCIGAADTAAPYGWWIMAYNPAYGIYDGEGGLAQVPITHAVQPGDTDPTVFFASQGNEQFGYNMTEDESWSQYSHCSGHIPAATPGWSNPLPASLYRTNTYIVIPDGAPLDANSDDLSFPVHFGRRSSLSGTVGYKGATTFMQWNGVARQPPALFASKTRISVGAMNAPWDGSTIPVV
jgi:hypothetical protein